jgi:hypothetical protein
VVTARKVARKIRTRRLRALFFGAPADVDYEAVASPDADPEQRAQVARLYAALDAMPPVERVAWALRHLQGEQLEEVARLVGCSFSGADHPCFHACILLMVATAAVGSGLNQLAKLVPTLPGAPQASRLAVVEGLVPMESVGAVQAVKIAKDGLTISLETGAVLASSIGPGVVTPGPGSPTAEGARDLPAIGSKIVRQMGPRGWTPEKIGEAIRSGERIPAVNKANGNPAVRYVHPVTGQSVVVDTVTNEVIHVGGPGFKYGPESGDLL